MERLFPASLPGNDNSHYAACSHDARVTVICAWSVPALRVQQDLSSDLPFQDFVLAPPTIPISFGSLPIDPLLTGAAA